MGSFSKETLDRRKGIRDRLRRFRYRLSGRFGVTHILYYKHIQFLQLVPIYIHLVTEVCREALHCSYGIIAVQAPRRLRLTLPQVASAQNRL